jgi:hypothetical protein
MNLNIQSNFNKTVTVQRLTDDEESGYIEGYTTLATDVPCHIQPLDDSYSQDIEGNFGKEWLMFCCYRDVLEGDRIIDGTDEYRVVGVEKFNFLGQNRHMELRIRRSNP